MSVLEYSEVLKRRIRRGAWKDQLVSTYQKTRESIERGAVDDAIEYADYFMWEAQVCYDLYVGWLDLLPRFGAEQGISEAEWRKAVEHVSALLRHPDGRPFVPEKRWSELQAMEEDAKDNIRNGRLPAALAGIESVRESWRQLHDRHVDLVDGLLSYVTDRLGEDALEPAYRYILVPFFEKRYARFNVTKNDWQAMLPINLYLCIEAMRGHLCGPRRWGEMELIEEPDRFVLRFDPCGSCGRAIRGDEVEGTPPRMEAPYNFHVTRKPYPWSWSRTGVDYYKVHTCFLFEILPIEKWGYPVRVSEPPTYPDRRCEKCEWYIYRDYRDAPEASYLRVGKKKPQ